MAPSSASGPSEGATGDERPAPRASKRPQERQSGPGWRVTPAPDGRGSPKAEPPRRFGGWPFVVLLLAVLALNFVFSRAALEPERVRIPYQPTFLQQIRDGNVVSIASEDSSLQGELKRAIR